MTEPTGAETPAQEAERQAQRLLAWIQDVDKYSTHYEGCESNHLRCLARQVVASILASLKALREELSEARHRRVTKRERREWEQVESDAATLRGYIANFKETPAMTASHRDYWQRRAEKAEAELSGLRAQQKD